MPIAVGLASLDPPYSYSHVFPNAGLSIVVVIYLAVDPPVRKRWPSRVRTWQSALEGRLLDPTVGRDVLIGCLVGVAGVFLREMAIALASVLDIPTVYMTTLSLVASWQNANPGPRYFLWILPYVAIGYGLISFYVAFLLYRVFRGSWLAWPVYFLVAVAVTAYLILPSNGEINSYGPREILWTVLSLALCWSPAVYVMWRYGLLATIIASLTHPLLIHAPMTYSFNVWYVGRTVTVLILVIGLAMYGSLVALGGPTRLFHAIFGED